MVGKDMQFIYIRDELINLCEMQGFATYADLHALLDKPIGIGEYDIGWTDLSYENVRVIPKKVGSVLIIPTPHRL